VLAVVASLVLAFAVWLGRWTRLVLLAVAGFGLVFAAGDIRELVHQLNESNAGLAAIAAVLIGLHWPSRRSRQRFSHAEAAQAG
jgi:ascorbate-specific PTS system EIIC-type component UlaA